VTASRYLFKFNSLIKGYGLTQLIIGFSSLSIIPLFARIPFANRWIYENWGQQFDLMQGANFLTIFGLLFIPTFFMGAQFPIVIKAMATKLATVGQNVGRTYACNTFGTIIGSFLAGFVFIPVLGLQTTILTAAFLNILLGLLFCYLGLNSVLTGRCIFCRGYSLFICW
jgi:spermidine synthase